MPKYFMIKKNGFTFIEIILAITIFSIGILAVSWLMTNNLKLMDQNNTKLQATVLAKEAMELIYNIRDSNVKKELSWNCIINDQMYTWTKDELSSKISRGDKSNFENIICKWHFSIDTILQVSFDPKNYIYQNIYQKINNHIDIFESRYNQNKLFFYEKDWISWYGNQSNHLSWKETPFARYLSFQKIKEWGNYLPDNKIMKVQSHVLYVKWWRTWEVIFEGFISNY